MMWDNLLNGVNGDWHMMYITWCWYPENDRRSQNPGVLA